MSAYSLAAQGAIVAALKAWSPAIASDRVYDHVPQMPTFPYVEIGGRQIIPDDTGGDDGTGDDGSSDFFDLHIWSRYRGDRELLEITDQIHSALHGEALSISGRNSAHAWIRTVRTMTDPDGLTRHGIVTVEVLHRT